LIRNDFAISLSIDCCHLDSRRFFQGYLKIYSKLLMILLNILSLLVRSKHMYTVCTMDGLLKVFYLLRLGCDYYWLCFGAYWFLNFWVTTPVPSYICFMGRFGRSLNCLIIELSELIIEGGKTFEGRTTRAH